MSKLYGFDVEKYLQEHETLVNLDETADEVVDKNPVAQFAISQILRNLKACIGGKLCNPLHITKEQITATSLEILTCVKAKPDDLAQAVIEELASATADRIIEDLLGRESAMKTWDDKKFRKKISRANNALYPKVLTILLKKILA